MAENSAVKDAMFVARVKADCESKSTANSHAISMYATDGHTLQTTKTGAPSEVGPGRSAGRRLRSNFLWTLAGNLTYAACQWGMLIALAKFGDATTVGQFSLALAVCAPVFMFSNLNLRGVQATDASAEFEFADYLGLRFLTTLLALAIIAAIALAGYEPAMGAVILFVGLAKAFESLSDMYYGRWQQYEHMDRIACSMIFRGLLSLGGMAITIFVTGNLVIASAILAGIWALMLIGYDARLAKVSGASGPIWNRRALGQLALLALPLGIVLAVLSLNSNLPRYFVEQSLGLESLGVFSALSYFVVAGGMVAAALAQAAVPQLAQRFAANDRNGFARLLLQLIGMAFVFGCTGVALAIGLGHRVLGLVYRPEYAQYNDVLVWLALSAGPVYAASFLGHGMTAARAFRVQPPLFLCTTLITALACWILVPRNGLVGAAQAILIGTSFQMLSSGAVVAALCWRKAGQAP